MKQSRNTSQMPVLISSLSDACLFDQVFFIFRKQQHTMVLMLLCAIYMDAHSADHVYLSVHLQA
jgi:hypothetical protein